MIRSVKKYVKNITDKIAHDSITKEYNKHIEMHKSELSILTPQKVDILKCCKPIVLFCCRDESLRLPYFLHYYRSIGFEGFIALDNTSKDGSRELLLEQEDVFLFEAKGSYAKARCGLYWMNHILRNHVAIGRWVLLVDVDELLVFPDVEQHGILHLIEKANYAGDTCVYTPMIDMYPRNGIDEVEYKPGEPFIGTCKYFDSLDTYRMSRKTFGYSIKGGVRDRIFTSSLGRNDRMNLTKYAFFKWDDYLILKSAHALSPKRLHDTSTIGALLHFKFFQDFSDKVNIAVRDNLHWNDSEEYRAYKKSIDNKRILNFHYENSAEYKNSGSLKDLFEIYKI